MRGAFLICKKEFLELAKDKRTLFFTFVLPILLYPVLFLVVGSLGRSDADQRAGSPSRIAILDPSRALEPRLRTDDRHFRCMSMPNEDPGQALKSRTLDLVITVEGDALAKLERGQTFEVKVLVDETEPSSSLALERLREALDTLDREEVAQRLAHLEASPELVHPSRIVTRDVSEPGMGMAKTLGAFLPYVLVLMMFQGSMQHGIHATAGEKERGTLQSLLATALPRRHIIWGKLAYIFCMGLLAAILNLLSMGLSMAIVVQRLASGTAKIQAEAAASLVQMADPGVLALGFLLLLPLGLLFSSFILFMGLRARSAAEAGTSLMPGLLVILVLGAIALAPGLDRIPALTYVPVLNVSIAIRNLFSQQARPWDLLVAFGMTTVFSALMTWASTRMLDRESVLFKER